MRKRMMWAAIALTMVATSAVTGCSSDNDGSYEEPKPVIDPVEPPTTLELTRGEQEMVNQSNEFAFRLFREARDEVASQILSPISITYALGMLNNGAAGETLAQINQVLGFSDSGADGINAFCYKMLNLVPTLDEQTKVMIANTIYMNKSYVLKDGFVQTAKTFYDAEPETRDFHDGETMHVINKWAADHTEQMIKEVLNEDTFNPDAVSYLLNAIYFKGCWTSKFDKAETQDEEFRFAGEPEALVRIPMMHQTANFECAETDDCLALRLPYGNRSFQMTVLLPKAETNALPKVPTAEEWQQLNKRFMGAKVDVKLPRFETNTDIDLKDIMSKLGMPNAFDNGRADFSNFCDVPTFIELMKQVAIIKLDEEGTEAAAVTVIGGLANAGDDPQPREPIIFHANHPFLYVISEQKTGAIFFIGQFTGHITGRDS